MSHIALQRVIVRMMFDSQFKKRIYQTPLYAQESADVSNDECRWLIANDVRSYGVDPHFSARTLHALLTEFPVSGAIALRCGADLNRFFSSRVMHSAVQSGQSLVLAFGDWMSREQRIRELSCKCANQIEQAMAQLRRPTSTSNTLGEIKLAPHAALLQLAAGSLALYQQGQEQLSRAHTDLASAALNPQTTLKLSPLQSGTENILIESKNDGQITMEALPEGLAAMLTLANAGCTLADLVQCANKLGAEGDEAQEIIDGLYSDGLLVNTLTS